MSYASAGCSTRPERQRASRADPERTSWLAEPEDVDADRFERLLGEGRAAAARGSLTEAGDLLEEALGLWRGEVLADLGAPEFAVAPAADLAEKRLLAHEARLDVQLALGRHVDAVPVLQSLSMRIPSGRGSLRS